MNGKINSTINVLPPFKYFCSTIGELPSSYLESMSYYETLVWLCNYLKETVIPTVNNTGNAVTELQNLYIELQNYVNTYFDNLDVQDEINNKLDEMFRDGSLSELVNSEIEELTVNLDARLDNVEYKVNRLTSMNPTPVSSVSGMTDTSKVYLNTSDGKWYYYDGNDWTIGGTYQSPVDGDDLTNSVGASLNAYTVLNPSVDTITIETGRAINATTGGRFESSTRSATLRPSTTFTKVVKLVSDTYTMKPYFYSANSGTWGDSYLGTTNDWGLEFYVGNAPYFCLVFKRNDGEDMTDSDTTAIRSALQFYGLTDKSLSISNSPADAKVTGDNINLINQNIEFRDNYYNSIDNVNYVQNVLVIYNNSTISTTTGQSSSSSNRARTGRTIKPRRRGAYIKMDGETYQFSVRYYVDDSEVYPDSYVGYEDWGNKYWVGKYECIGLVFRKVDDTPLTDTDITNIKNSLHFYKYTDDTLTLANYPADAKTVGDRINAGIFGTKLKATMSMYATFGVLGASWDNGFIYNGVDYIRNSDLSWGANLARRNGNTFNCYARDGATTRSALTNQYCLPKLLNESANDLYILTLGGNDSANLGLEYLGTIEDIKEDYTQNEDTFYGNYGKIIAQIMNHAPNAKIIMAMYYDSQRHGTIRTAFFNATIEIANHFNIPVAYWEHDQFYTSTSDFVDKERGNHPTAVQLSGLSISWENIYSECVYNNYDYFDYYLNDSFN